MTGSTSEDEEVEHSSKSDLPLICFKDGSPPIPDVTDTSLKNLMSKSSLDGFLGHAQNTSYVEWCIPFQKNLMVIFTNEQITPGVWYIGFFNGLGPARTQSKMTVGALTCSQSSRSKNSRRLVDQVSAYSLSQSSTRKEEAGAVSNASMLATSGSLITCNNSIELSCIQHGELSTYAVDIEGVKSHFVLNVTDIRLNGIHLKDDMKDHNGVILMSYIRYNAMPLESSHDYSADISRNPLVVSLPKGGRWYIGFQAVNQTEMNGVKQEIYLNGSLCFSFIWQVTECPYGKSGFNCTWEAHTLQRATQSSTAPFESYYLPDSEVGSKAQSHFSLETLLSNSSAEATAWTYFFFDIPPGAAGTNLHIRLSSDTKLEYDIYCNFGSLPSSDVWDYFTNQTTSSNNSTFIEKDDSSGKSLDFYILYPKEGTWSIGIKHPAESYRKYQTTLSISLDRCPRSCSGNGACHNAFDETGLTSYSFCYCDRDHGGFDCGTELVSPRGRIWQTIFLVGSNAAAILPSFWALKQKAFAEWVIFTASGVSSGLYHACDRGTWCVLSFGVLQFLDFWLSFMAVVSTIIYMTTIKESAKRAIQITASILTALLAATGATRSANIILVVAIGTLGLLLGLFLEFSIGHRIVLRPLRFNLNMLERWQSFKSWFLVFLRTLQKRFYWHYVLMGFIALAFAATSWTLESSQSYWIWHSLWHISIYTSSFFFLCSIRANRRDEDQEPGYELTRQHSPRNRVTNNSVNTAEELES